jgi:hypothetical protein
METGNTCSPSHCVHSSTLLFTPSVRDWDAGLRPLHVMILDSDLVKRTRALLGSNPPRISRCKLTAMKGAGVREHIGPLAICRS